MRGWQPSLCRFESQEQLGKVRVQSSILAKFAFSMRMIAMMLPFVICLIPAKTCGQTAYQDSLREIFQLNPRSVNQDSIRALAKRYIAARKKEFLGRPAPPLVTTTISGELWRLEDQRGRIVVLEFWASWCIACRPTTKAIGELHEKNKNNEEVLFVGVALDESLEKTVSFCSENNMDWLQLFEPAKGMGNSCAKAFDVWTIPEVCVIDKQGIVVSIFLKSRGSIETTIEALLRQRPRRSSQSHLIGSE